MLSHHIPTYIPTYPKFFDISQPQISEDELDNVSEKCRDTLEWLEHNENVEKPELDAQKRKLEAAVKPVMLKMYAEKAKRAAGGGGRGGKKSRR